MQKYSLTNQAGTFQQDTLIAPGFEELWSQVLPGIFDMELADTAVPRIDDALQRLTASPDDYRHLVPPESNLGLYGVRRALLSMRGFLVNKQATISGPVPHVVPNQA